MLKLGVWIKFDSVEFYQKILNSGKKQEKTAHFFPQFNSQMSE